MVNKLPVNVDRRRPTVASGQFQEDFSISSSIFEVERFAPAAAATGLDGPMFPACVPGTRYLYRVYLYHVQSAGGGYRYSMRRHWISRIRTCTVLISLRTANTPVPVWVYDSPGHSGGGVAGTRYRVPAITLSSFVALSRQRVTTTLNYQLSTTTPQRSPRDRATLRHPRGALGRLASPGGTRPTRYPARPFSAVGGPVLQRMEAFHASEPRGDRGCGLQNREGTATTFQRGCVSSSCLPFFQTC